MGFQSGYKLVILLFFLMSILNRHFLFLQEIMDLALV